jgi:bZIP transcription factor
LEGLGPTNKRQKSVSSEQDEDEKRRNFLERNRQGEPKLRNAHRTMFILYSKAWLKTNLNTLLPSLAAALKCRQRKKAWLNGLQGKVEILAEENEQLALQANSFREEIINLKSLLLAHKDCQAAKDNGSSIRMALEKPIPPPVATASQRQE